MVKKFLQASSLFGLKLKATQRKKSRIDPLGRIQFDASRMTCGGRGCNSESFMTLPSYQPQKPKPR